MEKYKITRIWSFILLFIGCALIQTFSYFQIDELLAIPSWFLYLAGMMGESSIDEEVAAKYKK